MDTQKEKSEGLISEATLMRSEKEEAEGNGGLSLKTPEKAIIPACSNVIEEEETEILTNIKVVSGNCKEVKRGKNYQIMVT